MTVKRFCLQRNYGIMCKLFLPENEIKRVVLGVHGFAGDKDSSMLEMLAEGLTDTALIAFDFACHGESHAGEDMLTVKNCKQDMLTVADYIRSNFPTAERYVFATSFGGFISLQNYGALKDFKFILCAPAIKMPQILLENVLKISEKQFADCGTVECGFERKIQLPYIFYSELLGEKDLFLNEYSEPILIIHGDRDDIVPISMITEFAQKHRAVQLEIINGADHRFKNKGEAEAVIAFAKAFINA